jgi:phosphoribosylformimino-5-aminoimidazole carboxamide ribotide isomerase
MLILPVIDIMQGRVVRAVGGRRSEYRPLVSQLTDSTEPIDVMTAIQERFGWTQFYVADVDAIIGHRREFYLRNVPADYQLWVDTGVRYLADTADICLARVAQVVVGSETLLGLKAARAIVAVLGTERLTFSLDMRDGRLIGVGANNWADPEAAAEALIAAGAERLIVLDLARVGELAGTGSDDVCRRLIRRYPHVAVLVGGGIRGVDDLRRLRDMGVSGALVASALHDGRITPEDLASVEA